VIAPARRAAYEVLHAVGAGRADLPSALAKARATLADERDRALAGEIATGTIRWQGAFDHVIGAFARRSTEKLDSEVLDILRLTMFQLLHLDRVPASAAVNDAVELTRAAGKGSATALVNAVLRRVSRERGALPLPSRPVDSGDRQAALDYLSISLSHPRWLAARWLDRYGFGAAEAWARFDNAAAPLTLRTNRLRTTPEALAAALKEHGIETRRGRFAPDALVVTAGNPLLTPLASQGLFVVQDEGSQLVPLIVGARPGEWVLDACASPGNKTTAIAADMENRGMLVAMDVRARRVGLLARTVAASGATCIRLVHADASVPLPFVSAEAVLPQGRVFNSVLLDAPCSGLGTIRRDPDIKWRRREEDLTGLADLQIRLLEHTASVLRVGGRIIYSTCSGEPEENEQVIERFLATHREFARASPERLPAPARPLVDDRGYFRTLPFRDGLEAFFAAILVRVKDLR
jgi:16S rRNA (cytosine967-C5)-methyltransferase